MYPIIITVASFTFQIAGAIILLLWSLRKCDRKIEKMCIEQDNSHWYDLDGYTDVSKDELQANAKVVYINILAFVDLILGYVCAIFVEDISLTAWCVLGLVAVATILLLCIELLLSTLIAKIKYPQDRKVKLED